MATEKLFYENVYCKTFQAKVLSCAAGKHGFDVVLDKTAFYPEGGGQAGGYARSKWRDRPLLRKGA